MDSFLTSRRDKNGELRHGVPASIAIATLTGGLMSRRASIDGYRVMGSYTGRMEGGEAADLLVYEAEKVELMTDPTTAKALGITVPPSPLARADEVIE
jgi:putative ABC transport system substrate-binding protein